MNLDERLSLARATRKRRRDIEWQTLLLREADAAWVRKNIRQAFSDGAIARNAQVLCPADEALARRLEIATLLELRRIHAIPEFKARARAIIAMRDWVTEVEHFGTGWPVEHVGQLLVLAKPIAESSQSMIANFPSEYLQSASRFL